MNELDQPMLSSQHTHWPILICLLGNFRLLKAGQPIMVHAGGKAEALLCYLGFLNSHRIPHERLVQALWPASDPVLAHQSLNSLVYGLRKLIGDAIGGSTPVLHVEGYYRLNLEAGVSVDIACFDALAHAGDLEVRAGDLAAATASYRQAVELYRGDLCIAADVHALIERERLRARYLTILAHLADYYYHEGDYPACIGYAWQLLGRDPCREDAHRLLMRSHVRRGQRAEALRQYRDCVEILRAEFDVTPEPATTALFEQVRLDPSSI